MSRQKIPYETNAERRTVEGWCCKTCKRFWGDGPSAEHAARYCCCSDRKCEKCGWRTDEKYYTLCKGCRDLAEIEKFSKLESRPYDGNPVVEFGDDNYYWDEDDLRDWITDYDIPTEDVRLVFAEQSPIRWDRTIAEVLEDHLAEDQEWDTSEIDKQIAEWVEQNAPKVYRPTKIAVSQESIRELMRGGSS